MDETEEDQKEQDRWEFLTTIGFKTLFFPARLGAFGENAKKGAERTAENVGPIFTYILAVALIAGAIWFLGRIFQAW